MARLDVHWFPLTTPANPWFLVCIASAIQIPRQVEDSPPCLLIRSSWIGRLYTWWIFTRPRVEATTINAILGM
ncbi:MAG TPA: hypothetical protein VKM55_11255 [Candidatus Lokiarchaeia archaeon]|nr:hypothetical protein [Candidatus Lokiarchaeia archaeon]